MNTIPASTKIIQAIEKARAARSEYLYRTGKKSLSHIADDMAVSIRELIEAIQEL